MNNNRIRNVYFIPGWGFNADAVRYFNINNCNFFGLNYFNEINLSINYITSLMANTIKEQSYIIGWSLGGLFAINIGFLYPHKIRKIILLASQPKLLEDVHWDGISSKQINEISRIGHTNFNSLHNKFIQLVNYPNRNIVFKKYLFNNHCFFKKQSCLSLLKLIMETDLRHEYKYMNSKILHIINDKDVILHQNINHLIKLNPNIKVATINGAGHAGFISYKNIYNKIIKDFINE